jgi:hypothetical protein
VGAPREGLQALPGLPRVSRLAEDTAVEHDVGIDPEDERAGSARGARPGLAQGVLDHGVLRRPFGGLVHPGRNRLERNPEDGEELAAAR